MNLKCKKAYKPLKTVVHHNNIQIFIGYEINYESHSFGAKTKKNKKKSSYVSPTDQFSQENCSTLQFASHLALCLSHHKQEFRNAKRVRPLGLKKTSSGRHLLKYEGARDDPDQNVDSQEWADKNFMAGRPM